ncbi:hypothetical protein CLOSTASPAR_01832 [[Clostridium] asparagiforme DSM 15981]|uniref:Uncharacterized protein n=1 Tax=[Clostridium] asparagiforme DSM 15981 TaxID=518636 RepID=C0CXV7_9FIRM|nr:hypothetical protein CLOSTASPAR_01832 [[Clostridium] asparagiforme DSM 15981]
MRCFKWSENTSPGNAAAVSRFGGPGHPTRQIRPPPSGVSGRRAVPPCRLALQPTNKT